MYYSGEAGGIGSRIFVRSKRALDRFDTPAAKGDQDWAEVSIERSDDLHTMGKLSGVFVSVGDT